MINSATRKWDLHSEEPNISRTDDSQVNIRVSWLRVTIGVAVGLIGLFFIVRNVEFADVVSAYQDAILGYVLLAVAVILITIITKTWRWQLIFKSGPDAPGFRPLFWALVTGQFFNIVVPFRTGEIARVLSLDQQEQVSKSKTLSTLVIEKTLDTAGLVATILIVLPFIAIPDEVSQRGNTLAIITLVALPILFLVALNSHRLSRYAKGIGERLPPWMRMRFIQILEAGLDGLAAFRSRRYDGSIQSIIL